MFDICAYYFLFYRLCVSEYAVCTYVYGPHVHSASEGQKKASVPPENEITDDCEWPCRGTGYCTQVLYRSNK